MPGRCERDLGPVRRPVGCAVVPGAIRQLQRLATFPRDDEKVFAPVVGEPLAVHLVLQRVDSSVGFRLGVGVRPLARLRDEGDPLRIRPPDDPLHAERRAALGVAERLCLAAVRRHDVKLRLVPLATQRQESQPASVGRPARRAIPSLPRRELTRRSARHVHHPDRRAVLIRLPIHPARDEGHAIAVRVHRHIGDPGDGIEVVRRHPAHLCFLHSSASFISLTAPPIPRLGRVVLPCEGVERGA